MAKESVEPQHFHSSTEMYCSTFTTKVSSCFTEKFHSYCFFSLALDNGASFFVYSLFTLLLGVLVPLL